MTPDQYQELVKQVKSLQDSLNLIDKDLEHDRGEIGNINIRLGTVEGQLSELRKGLNKQTEKTVNAVSEALEPVLDETSDLKKTIERKKFKILREPWNWRKLFRK